ncbi:MAG TPA: MOSC domain-containing protein [Gemmatimonadaceae bacterium]|jgi:MOSC domain-containing protein YiiM|nr:MOSC domain-containing protein [Gemmatimonadaceae bacterium]
MTTASSGRVEAMWLKRSHRGPMDAVREIHVTSATGIVGGVDRSRRRQITLIEQEVWERLMRELGGDADPSARRANLMLTGIRLANTRGRVLRVGEARLAIGGELTPCERMDEVLPGLRAAMRPDWRGGVFAQVLGDATIRVGDTAEWETS